jgi:hypothetical protein
MEARKSVKEGLRKWERARGGKGGVNQMYEGGKGLPQR